LNETSGMKLKPACNGETVNESSKVPMNRHLAVVI